MGTRKGIPEIGREILRGVRASQKDEHEKKRVRHKHNTRDVNMGESILTNTREKLTRETKSFKAGQPAFSFGNLNPS